MLLSAPAWALNGPSTGGGGFVLSCPETPVSAAKVELLDIYEGRSSLSLPMATASGSLQDDYTAGVDRTYTLQGYPNLAEERHEEIMTNLTNFMQSTRFVSAEAELPTAVDLGEQPWIPSQCHVKQVAYFDDRSSTIYILKPMWDKMDSISQAALVHHELWYREQRRAGEQTSENARRAVAQAFTVSGLVPLDEGLPLKPSKFAASGPFESEQKFTTNMSSFYAANFTGSGITRLQFTQVNGVGQLSKTWADFPAMTWDFKLGRSKENPSLVACILQTDGVNQQSSATLNGISVKGYSVTLRIKTGEPVKMVVLKNGIPMTEGYIAGGINCSESLH